MVIELTPAQQKALIRLLSGAAMTQSYPALAVNSAPITLLLCEHRPANRIGDYHLVIRYQWPGLGPDVFELLIGDIDPLTNIRQAPGTITLERLAAGGLAAPARLLTAGLAYKAHELREYAIW